MEVIAARWGKARQVRNLPQHGPLANLPEVNGEKTVDAVCFRQEVLACGLCQRFCRRFSLCTLSACRFLRRL